MVNQLVILKFGQGNLQRGFAGITALLGSESKPPQMQITGKLPASPELIALYKRWQLLYVACYDCLGWHLRIDFSEDNADVIQFSKVEFHEICKEFLNQFNAWLKSEDFLDIRERLRTYLNRSDPIRVLVETDDDLLRRFLAVLPPQGSRPSARTVRAWYTSAVLHISCYQLDAACWSFNIWLQISAQQ